MCLTLNENIFVIFVSSADIFFSKELKIFVFFKFFCQLVPQFVRNFIEFFFVEFSIIIMTTLIMCHPFETWWNNLNCSTCKLHVCKWLRSTGPAFSQKQIKWLKVLALNFWAKQRSMCNKRWSMAINWDINYRRFACILTMYLKL